MNIKILLRLCLAVIFATLAVIFSELVPPVNGINPILLRVFITLVSASVGFLVFPDIAAWTSKTAVYLFNFIVNRLASEILNQLMRVPRESFHLPFFGHTEATVGNLGGVSLQRPLILDTSAIIDGRILDIAKTGFIYGTVLIPNYVLIELQQVSDSADFIKRSRGRRGFEIVEELKKLKNLRIEIWEKDSGGKSVDSKLVQLAKNVHGKVITTDFNLNKVASISGVTVLNVNDLANAIKTIAIPGEVLEVKIMHLGKDTTQGIGYLPDGTMIVLKDGANLVGQTVKMEVTKILQIPAGRMIFTKKS